MGSSGVIGSGGGGAPGVLNFNDLLDVEHDTRVVGYTLVATLDGTLEYAPFPSTLQLNAGALVVKRESAGAYAWPSGSAPDAGTYSTILHDGVDDPASTTGGQVAEGTLWAGGEIA